MSVISSIKSWSSVAPHHMYGREGWFRGRPDLLRKTTLAAASIVVVALTIYTDATRQAIHIIWDSAVLRPFMIVGGLYGTSTTMWSFWRFYLAMRYRPVPTVEAAQLPKITIIVPAYNEGALVGETLRRLAEADYPADRFEIIVSDDGSTDDTWRHIKRAARDISDRGRKITALHFDDNRGKRWVLWEGFRRGTGDVFVTVDSDSLVEPDALKAVVSPIVRDERVGGVAGNVRVLNREDGIIPRMLAVRYVLTFDYKRAAQSMMGGGGLLCCAGALAAYRRQAVMPILDKWLHQRYLGGEARAGEDHAMTNFILRQGYHVRYQRTARVFTKSPKSYANLAKMFLRWGRSNVRESVHTGSYVFSNFKGGSKLAIRYNYLHCAVGLALPYVFLTAALVLTFIYPVVFGLKLLAACVMGGVFSMVFFAVRERSSEAIYAVVYSFYSMLLLGWVWPYALLTSHKSVWMTRDKPSRAQQLAAVPTSTQRRRATRRPATRRRARGRTAPARAIEPLRAAS